jgi:hypothetical protein
LRRTPWLVVMGVPVLLTWGGHHLTWTFDWFCIIIGIVYPYLHPTFGQNSAECSFFSNEGVQIVSTHKSQLPIGRYPGWRNGLENCVLQNPNGDHLSHWSSNTQVSHG